MLLPASLVGLVRSRHSIEHILQYPPSQLIKGLLIRTSLTLQMADRLWGCDPQLNPDLHPIIYFLILKVVLIFFSFFRTSGVDYFFSQSGVRSHVQQHRFQCQSKLFSMCLQKIFKRWDFQDSVSSSSMNSGGTEMNSWQMRLFGPDKNGSLELKKNWECSEIQGFDCALGWPH